MAGKIMLWDIEATNLCANFGFILCVGLKELGSKTTTILRIDKEKGFGKDCTNDKSLVLRARDMLAEADVWVAHYGQRFDVPYLNTRLLMHGEQCMPPVPLVDTWRISRDKLRLNSNRLASITDALGLEDKTKLSGPEWVKAAAGNRKAIDYIAEHCKQDVLVLEQAYLKLRGLSTNHPSMVLPGWHAWRDSKERAIICPNCGDPQAGYQHRGYQYSRTSRKPRLQCKGKTCHAWFYGRPEAAQGV